MTQLAVERIKLFSTRSPLWCTLLALALSIGFAALIASTTDGDSVPLSMTQIGYQFGLMVTMVMAALAVTTEYRFGTIRATFQATPNRTKVLLAKAALVGSLGFVIGELAAFGSLAVTKLIAPGSDLALSESHEWRQVVGVGLVFLVGSVLALAVGVLLRQTAGAVAVLLLWPLLVESMTPLIPSIGEDLGKWMPFGAADHFLTGGSPAGAQPPGMGAPADMPFGPWAALAYFAAIGFGLLAFAIIVANRRDA